MSSKSWHASTLGARPLAPETLMMGYGYDPHLSERSLKPPLFLTSTFVFRSAEDGKAFFELAYGLRQKRPNEEPGLIYSRINNPDLETLGLVSRLPTESPSRSRSFRTSMQGGRLDVQLRSQRGRGRGVFRPQSAESD